MIADISTARKGDVVRFASYALRVEAEPEHKNNSTILRGRISIDGCPLVTKRFIGQRLVEIERD